MANQTSHSIHPVVNESGSTALFGRIPGVTAGVDEMEVRTMAPQPRRERRNLSKHSSLIHREDTRENAWPKGAVAQANNINRVPAAV